MSGLTKGRRGHSTALWGGLALSAVLLLGCAAPPQQRAPVAERSPVPATRAAVAPLPPGAENAGQPGFYTVRPGDTLIRIGLETGQSWRDIAAWNGITNPDRIEVGQVLRVVPPETALAARPVVAAPAPSAAGTTAAPVATPSVQGRALTDPAPPAAAPEPARAAPGVAAAAPAPAPAAATADTISLIWPAAGPVIEAFDESRNKGIGIGGRAGDPVLAAAAGRVVYAGAGLRGYGNLVIIKHNNTFLTAYAHNQSLLVREDQVVRQGQRIAEMGSSDADRVKLHFEVRRQGRPVDPATFLPRR
ncbi:peptidoglycan DD-metalloendopeptidase family protein [Serpentinimonas raichei]|uniref:peptidoglycan DD-metalloendopeptidase family protein n=1 Tax=Serpentinimonas raichei TaxID=1458425 RepID=UPI001E28DD9E|nr:peptidoglycan DD-metalloendopeptidase family protein [Serpentinimonas raichei]